MCHFSIFENSCKRERCLQISTVNASGICPDLKLFNTAAKDGGKYVSDRRPDISVCDHPRDPSGTTSWTSSSGATYRPRSVSPDSPTTCWHAMELCIGCMTDEQDPFSDAPRDESEDNSSFERSTSLEPVEARGKIVSHAGAQMNFQFRSFCFSICLIAQTDARLIRWDRSGAIVTERFNFTRMNEISWQSFSSVSTILTMFSAVMTRPS
ncbi:hypothetical protein DENSPDRAFT_832210 [Dentipellis sp. KUC8613]|nr:hypothetical protein DENSPDRAFT_832210 [Dentipellis sp. KUC8613]